MRYLERAVIALLGVWCAIGIGHTAQSLLGPAGWVAGRPRTESGSVGMPLPGSAELTAIGRLLENDPDADDPALVILPANVDPSRALYIRYQLAHTRYPRRVDVTTASGGTTPDSRYATVVAVAGVRLEAPWQIEATLAGFSAWERGES